MKLFGPKKGTSFKGGYNQYRSPAVYRPKLKKKSSYEWVKNFPKINFRIVLAAVVVLLAVYGVFFSGYFRITDVIVEGNHLVSADSIRSEIPVGRNIFFFSTKDVKQSILHNNTEIQDVQLYRGLPNAVKLVVLERENKIIWKSGADRYYVSSQGLITRKLSPDEVSSLPEVTDVKNITVVPATAVASSHFVTFIQNINDNFFSVTNIKPTTYEVAETTFDLIAHTEAGFYVKFDTTRSSAKQLDDLKNVLVAKRADIKEYIDLRVDGWAYYK